MKEFWKRFGWVALLLALVCSLAAEVVPTRRSVRVAAEEPLSPPLTNLVHQYDFVAANVTKNGSDEISAVADLVGSSNLSATGAPAWADTQLNGYATATTDGTDDYLQSGTWGPHANYTVAVVARLTTTANSATLVDGKSDTRAPQIWRNESGNFEAKLKGASTVVLTDGAADTGWHVFVVVCSRTGSAQSFRIDGVEEDTDTDSLPNTNTGVTLGARDTGFGDTAAEFAEVLVYNAALSGTNLTDLETYLTTKYGL